ncbi:MAG: hypothetical protein AAF135_23560 [Bacteroidota bacterium]
MSLKSQTPPTPPTPPPTGNSVQASQTYALAETSNSIAFSTAFDPASRKDITRIIRQYFTDFPAEEANTLYAPAQTNETYLKIELKQSELKIEFKSSAEDTDSQLSTIKSITNEIIAL